MIIRINAAGWLSVDDLAKCELGYWGGKNIEESTTERLQMLYVQVLQQHACFLDCFVNFKTSAETSISGDLNEHALDIDF